MTTQPSFYQPPTVGLKPTGFYFQIPMFPDVNFTVQAVTIPAVNFGVTMFDNPHQMLKFPGDKMDFGPLHVRLILEEELTAYTELYGWMRELAFLLPSNDLAHQLQERRRDLPGVDPNMPVNDLLLTVLNSNNNPTVQFTFRDGFPIFIGPLTFDTTEDGQSYMYCDIEFAFNWFEVNKASK